MHTTGLIPVCINGYRESGSVSSRWHRKKAKVLVNKDMNVATVPSVAISREIGWKEMELLAQNGDNLVIMAKPILDAADSSVSSGFHIRLHLYTSTNTNVN